MRKFLTPIIVAGFAMTSPVYAQSGGFGDIIEDIFNQGGTFPNDGSPEASGLIDNIPVNITIDESLSLDDKLLVVSAYAPPPPSGGMSEPQLLGETRLLMTGLTQEMQIIIAAPAPVTDNIDYTRLEAKVLDENGNPVLTSKEDGFYRGSAPADITLVAMSYKPETTSPPPIAGLETAKGKVQIANSNDMFRGSSLTLQLVETGLAGGRTKLIAAETILDLDQRTPPFDFEIDRAVRDGDDTPLAFDAWISDWAGRKTHVMGKLVPYNGPERAYRLKLDTLKTGGNLGTSEIVSPEASPNTVITGEAQFDAYKGLPAGSKLTISLNRAVGALGANRELTSRTILLDGLSGNVKFDLVASSTEFDPLIPPPMISIRLTDASGRLFFSSGDIPAQDGFNRVQLTPSTIY